jgi:hypothetical protein
VTSSLVVTLSVAALGHCIFHLLKKILLEMLVNGLVLGASENDLDMCRVVEESEPYRQDGMFHRRSLSHAHRSLCEWLVSFLEV